MKRFNLFGKDKEESRDLELLPFRGLDLDSFFGDFFSRPFEFGFLRPLKMPAVEVYEEDNKVVVKAELPGVDKKDVRLRRDGDILTISAERNKQREEKKRNYYYAERSLSRFHRSVRLPAGTKEDVKASYKDGVLTVEFSKSEEASEKGRDIEIE